MPRTIREPFNALSHLIGAVLMLTGLAFLIWRSHGNPEASISFAIYGILTTMLFAASAAYHWSHREGLFLRRFDHAAIYFMIAGTYTPICILGLDRSFGWVVLALEWSMAAIGVTATFTMTKPPTWLRLTLYLGMGWMMLPLLGALSQRVSSGGLVWTFAGGLAYTIGTVVYASKRPDPWPGRFGFHEIWHLFVLAGCACHFVLMLNLASRL